MNTTSKRYLIIDWGNDIKNREPFYFFINDVKVELPKQVSILVSKLVHDEYLQDSTVNSVSVYLNLSCNNTIDIISEFFSTGVLRFENDQLHRQDIFEVGKVLGIEFLINLFKEYARSSVNGITEENFFDACDYAMIKNDKKVLNECISFFASNMYDFQEEYKVRALKRYGYDFFEQVLASKSLKIINEDSLVRTIIALSEYDNSFFCILNNVRVEFCNQDSIKAIKNFAVNHSLESISTEVFERALLSRSPIHHKLSLSKATNYTAASTPNKLQYSDTNYYQRSVNPAKLQLSNLNSFMSTTYSNKFNISTTQGLHYIDHSDENKRKLLGLSKTKDNLNRIYDVLEKASQEEDYSTIKYAVDEKYTDICDDKKKNLVLIAAWKNNLSLVKQLFNCGANVRCRSYTERTILHYFCQYDNLEGVKFALNFINVNDQNSDGCTPLHDTIKYAAENQVAICEYLISQPNINKTVKNKDNETALQSAIKFAPQKIVDLLKRNGFKE